MDEVVLARILEAQGFITDRLQELSGGLFTQFGWNQRKGDWGAEIYYLAAYIGLRRFVVPFSLEELISDSGSEIWKRVLLDKIDWFIEQVRSEMPEEASGQRETRGPSTDERLTALYVLQNAEFNYMADSRKWAVCGWRQVMYVLVASALEVEEARQCMQELWGAFQALRRRYPKIYTVLDLNRMDINSEEFRHYMKENWLHLVDREDLAIGFVEKSGLKKAIWSSIARLLGKSGRVKLFATSDSAFAWVQRQIKVNGFVQDGR